MPHNHLVDTDFKEKYEKKILKKIVDRLLRGTKVQSFERGEYTRNQVFRERRSKVLPTEVQFTKLVLNLVEYRWKKCRV